MQQNRLVHVQQAMKFRVWSGVDHSGVILAKTVAVNIIHLRSDPEGNSFVFLRVLFWCFPRQSRGKHQDSRENKTNWFPEGPDIKWFVIFLDFHFNNNKRITGANQNSGLGTYKNTNLILKTTEWMIYKVLFLYSMFFLH